MFKVNSKDKNSKVEKKLRNPRKITETYLHNAGLYYLQRFAASSAHFKTVMTRKIDRSCTFHKDQNRDDCIALLEKLIIKFEDVKLLDDEVYTRGVVHSQRRRGLSSRMIQTRLQAKGLEQSVIKKALQDHAEHLENDAELVAALRLARRKRIGPYLRKEPVENQFQKSLGIMARAGFSYNIARQALEMDQEEAELTSESGGN